MACLAPPQFKWPPSTRAAVFREPSAAGGSSRPVRVHCAAFSTAVFDEERAESLIVGPPLSPHRSLPVSFEEALLDKEAVVAAAAAEAVALARAAAEAAREVARMAQTDHRPDAPQPKDQNANGSKRTTSFLAKEALRTQVGLEASRHAGVHYLQEEEQFSSIFSDESQDDDDDQGVRGVVAVRSARRAERRARRVSAATKAAKSFSVQTPVRSSSRKKRLKCSWSPLGCLYKMADRNKLLTKEKEVEFSKGIQDLLKLEAIQKKLVESNGGETTFSQWAAAAGTDENTLRKRLNYGVYCKNMMVKSNVRLVISIAKEFEGPQTELADLIQDGVQGLIRGALKFDASKGFRFSTYSHWWIKQAMRRSVLAQSQLIRLPAYLADARSRVKECRIRLGRELERLPTIDEIAQDTGMPIRRVKAVLRLPRYTISLSSKVGCADSDDTYEDIMPDTSSETPEEAMHRWFMKRDVDRALDSLNPREKQVMRYRFGIDDGRRRTLIDIGRLMGVSRERIRQMEMAAFRKLRSEKSVQSLQYYLHSAESW